MRPMDEALIARLLDVIEQEVLAKTRRTVAAGNKIFGAAVLRKADLSVVIAESNNETENPLWHGEVHAIKRFHELPPADRPDPGDCLFVSTHEPCTMCLSAITWAGFDNFSYLFSHEDSRDAFNIPHDLKILKEVFGLEPGGYRAENAFWKSYDLARLASESSGPRGAALRDQVERLRSAYAELSESYQASKGAHGIPLD